MPNRPDDDRDERRMIPKADEHELHSDPPPHRADAFDRMQRRYSDTIKNADQPSNVAPEDEFEGHHAEPSEGRPPVEDGIEREEPVPPRRR